MAPLKPRRRKLCLEVCIDSLASARNANAGGAHRLEVCSDLDRGGLTPSPGLVEACQQVGNADLMVMIRPRAGDFCYSQDEFEVMRRDLIFYRDAANISKGSRAPIVGFVFGLLDEKHEIDQARTRELVELSKPYSLTFHRAFDWTPDPMAALDCLIELGFDRVLSSGQKSSAEEGIELLAALQKRASDRIGILPGAGINQHNAEKILEQTDASELHASARRLFVRSRQTAPNVSMGAADNSEKANQGTKICDPKEVQALVAILNTFESSKT